MASEPIVTVVLFGPPKPKGRPRTRVIGKFATIYTDAETRKYENALKAAGVAAMGNRPPVAGPLAVTVMAYMPVPGSWPQKKRSAALAGDLMPVSGIDLDNIVKQVDGLNYHAPRFKGDKERRPIIWMTDAQIVSINAVKLYDAVPRLEVSVYHF